MILAASCRFATAAVFAAAGQPDASNGPTSYDFARLEQFNSPRALWIAVAAVGVILASIAIWQYRRESESLPPVMGTVLATLRLTALLAAILFYLGLERRTDRQIVEQSRAVVLLDVSQSMSVEDQADAVNLKQRRSDATISFLRESSLLDDLRAEHDLSIATFDSEVRRIAQWPRASADGGDSQSRVHTVANALSEEIRSSDSELSTDAGEPASRSDAWLDQLTPIGSETRIGDALARTHSETGGGPLAGIIVLTDGRQTSGINPVDAAKAIAADKVPVFAVGLGSTDPRRNVRVQELVAPARAYPDDKTIVRALVFGEGLRGRDVDVELYVSEIHGEDLGAAVLVDRQSAAFAEQSQTVSLEFELEPTAPGRLAIEARVTPPPDDQFASDNSRREEIEIIESSSRVLLIASAATRDYRFVRNQLQRDRHTTVDVLLQMSPPGISQDAERILDEFPRLAEELFQYDCIVAFDPDWMQLDAQQVDLLEKWVAEEAGGLIVVAGPIHTSALAPSAEHAKIRALYPVEFQRRLTLLDDGVFGSKTAWPVAFTREGETADFLRLGDTSAESGVVWTEFPGVFGCYAVRGPKPGARVLGRFSDPDAGISVERPVYFADQFYGAGRVFYMGSGEVWRLRALDPKYFELLYTQLIRHVSQGRLLRGSSLGYLMAERDRYQTGDSVQIRAQLKSTSREPYVAPQVTARVTDPAGTGRNINLPADESKPGSFLGQFTTPAEGAYRIELSVPGTVDQQLVRRIDVSAPDLEFRQTNQHRELLVELARTTEGRYYPSLDATIEGTDDAAPIASLLTSQAETRIQRGKPDQEFTEALNRILLIVICAALSCEWFLRRLMKLA